MSVGLQLKSLGENICYFDTLAAGIWMSKAMIYENLCSKPVHYSDGHKYTRSSLIGLLKTDKSESALYLWIGNKSSTMYNKWSNNKYGATGIETNDTKHYTLFE